MDSSIKVEIADANGTILSSEERSVHIDGYGKFRFVWTSVRSDGFYTIGATLGNSKVEGSFYVIDSIQPEISEVQYSISVKDYQQFNVSAKITDKNLKSVVVLQNSVPVAYDIFGSTYVSRCTGPFKEGVVDHAILAIDAVGNAAFKEFNITVFEGDVKIEGEGKNETVKLELEAKWKKGEAKGEFELQEKERDKDEEKFKAHGRIDKLFKDCDSVFRISGTAKVEYGEGANKTKETVIFAGSMAEDKITIIIDGKEFVVPAKVNIKEK